MDVRLRVYWHLFTYLVVALLLFRWCVVLVGAQRETFQRAEATGQQTATS